MRGGERELFSAATTLASAIKHYVVFVLLSEMHLLILKIDPAPQPIHILTRKQGS